MLLDACWMPAHGRACPALLLGCTHAVLPRQARTSCALCASTVKAAALGPSSEAKLLSLAPSLAATTTVAPCCCTSRRHRAEPMPPEAPNTTYTAEGQGRAGVS